MRKLLISLLFPLSVFAQQQIKTKAILESVTVYNNGAQLSHKAKVNLPAGTSEIVINNISGRINENSIQVDVSHGVTILAVQFNRDFLNTDAANPEIKKLNDSLKTVSAELTKTKNAKTIEEQTLQLLDENRKSGGTASGTNVTELAKLTEYYRTKNAETRNAIAALNLIEEKQNNRLTALQQQIAELRNNPSQQLGQLVLQLMTKENTEANYNVSYVTPSASWLASYDVKAINTSNPLAIVYKAAIVQSTGLDWKKVKLSLSTGNPNYNITAPNLNPWFVSAFNPVPQALAGKISGIQIRGMASPVVNDEQALNDVVAVGYGKVNRRTMSVAKVSTVNDYTSINETQLGVTFEIDIPYDINSDNKPHTVAFKEYQVPANYRYFATPKLSNDAYLLADVINWEKLNLQAGEANIIFEGAYTGKSYINPASIQDTMSLSLGRDKKIIITKEKQEDFSSTKFIGSNKKQLFTYLIKIRNTKKEAIEVFLKDQYPLSTESDIEIELLESSGAEVNKETGMLSWKLKIAPNETKTLKLSYSVKAPKSKIIAGL
ncbi:MAG: mucoidy inhibitor MuiA family protein [Pedobacter sp.]|nr:MAG: mucoidy inhibitor MuiA family protein [Pedobacter sp.]